MTKRSGRRVKRVPDSSSEVLLTADAQAVDGSKAGFTTSPHEECAVEIATQLTSDGGEATVVTLGDKDAAEQLRSALAVGCHQATHVVTEAHTLGPADVAREIAAVVKDHEAAGRSHDLVLLGSDAADSGDFQVGIRLAYELGRPVVNGATTVTVEDGVGRRGRQGSGGPGDLPGPAAGGRHDPRGRRRAALPQREGPDAGQEGPDRGAHARRPSPAARSGSSCCCPRRPRAACRSWARAPAAAPAVVDLFEQLGVLSR